MKSISHIAAAAALAFAMGSVAAQPGPGMMAGPGQAASGPFGGPGMMAGRGPGPGASEPLSGRGRMAHGPVARSGADSTWGWSMMTPAERREHHARMSAMTSYDDCKAYVEQHHQEMLARAKEKGRSMPAAPRRDACAPLKH